MATTKELALINTIREEGKLDSGEPSFLREWTPVRYIGRGNFGEVYEIQKGGQRAALKIIPINEDYMSEYYTEIKALERIRGEVHAVHIDEYAVVNIDKGAYIQKYMIIRMELLRSLPGIMDEGSVIQLGIEMCDILGKCHSGTPRLIHCDIKQENILSDGRVYKLADFGVAKFSSNTHTYGFRGTLTHMSPEMHNLESYDGRSDIYSLGITMYALLNGGNIPFSKGNDIEQAVKRRFDGEQLPDIPGVSPGMMRILRKMCAMKQEKRYRSAQELASDLYALAEARRLQRETEEAEKKKAEQEAAKKRREAEDSVYTATSALHGGEEKSVSAVPAKRKPLGMIAAAAALVAAIVCGTVFLPGLIKGRDTAAVSGSDPVSSSGDIVYDNELLEHLLKDHRYDLNDLNEECTYGGEYEGFDYYITEDNDIVLGKYKGEETSVNIPAAIDGKAVRYLYDCFVINDKITAVIIPDSVVCIGIGVFSGSALTSVNIPDSVTYIGDGAFSSCASLMEITVSPDNKNYASHDGILMSKDEKTLISVLGGLSGEYSVPDGITSIGNYSFSSCDNLTSVTIPDGVTSIGDRAFSGCDNLNYVEIPNSVTSIGNNSFAGCDKLTSVTIPDGVTSIGEDAFDNCEKLTSVTIPDSVTYIGDAAFTSCASLMEITVSPNNKNYASHDGILMSKDEKTLITVPGGLSGEYSVPDGFASIGNYAFCGCDKLTFVTISDGVTSIGDGAFLSCDNLIYVGIPNSVTSIGERAFSYCDEMTSVKIPDGVTSIGESAFNSCDNLTSVSIPDSVTSIADRTFYGCDNLTSVNIPDSVTSIGESAFNSCENLTAVTIPSGVTSIGDSAFLCCDNLKEIAVSPDNERYTSFNGALMSKDKKTLFTVPGGYSGSFSVPNGVTSIGDAAFYECEKLTSVAIPNSVASIGEYAFSYCHNLKSVKIPDGVTSIADFTFDECDSLTSVMIPDSVTSIGKWAFSHCYNLKSVKLPDGVTSIGEGAFNDCDSLTSITIPESVTSIGKFAFSSCNLTSITIPDSVTSIGDSAFGLCYDLTVTAPHEPSYYGYNLDSVITWNVKPVTGGTDND